MTTRKLTSSLSLLAALLFAAAAHAGDYSMDVGTASERGAGASSAQNDCASSGSAAADGGRSVTGIRDSTRASASVANDRSAPAAAEAAESTPGGSNTSTESISVPIKARSNRWQSLVPGAIK